METLRERVVGEDTNLKRWRQSLVAGVAVIGAVAVLLELLARTVQQIEDTAAQIWTVGKQIAGNTVHVPLLVRTNQIVADISQTADGIASAAERIQRAADRDKQI